MRIVNLHGALALKRETPLCAKPTIRSDLFDREMADAIRSVALAVCVSVCHILDVLLFRCSGRVRDIRFR